MAQSGHSSAASSAGKLRDRNNLKLLTGRADFISDSFAHQKPCHRDPIAGTPYHKHVAVRLSLVPVHEAAACQMQSERIHASAAAG